MVEDKIYCPECKGGVEFLTEEDDGMIKSELIWCARCKLAFNIQTGPQVDDWAFEIDNKYTD